MSIKKPLNIIDINNLKSDEIFLLEIKYEMFDDEVNKIFLKNNSHLIFWCDYYDIFSKKRDQTQEEFPLMALPWFIDTIEKKFWDYKPLPTDKPGNVSETIIIDNEKIGINPMKNCCEDNLPGYSFWNNSRKDYISETTPQDRQIPKFMLKEGLLDEFKRISSELNLKKY